MAAVTTRQQSRWKEKAVQCGTTPFFREIKAVPTRYNNQDGRKTLYLEGTTLFFIEIE